MLESYLKIHPAIDQIIKNDTISLRNGSNGFNLEAIKIDFLENKKTIFVVLPSLYEAQQYYDSLINMVNEDDVLFYPCDELVTSQMLVSSIEFKLERINTIKALLDNSKKIVVTHASGIAKRQLSKKKWQESVLDIKVGDEIDNIGELLYNVGYKRTYTVSKIGEYSIRGNIIDVFPINSLNPYRIDLFGDEIDEIKEFDINNQLSIKKVNSINIIPLSELFYTDNEKEKAISYLENKAEYLDDADKDTINKDIESLNNRSSLDLLGKYIFLFDNNENTIIDFSDDYKLYFIGYEKIITAYDKMIEDIRYYCDGTNTKLLYELKFLYDITKIKKGIRICQNATKSLDSREPMMYLGDFKQLVDDLNRYTDKKVFISFKEEKALKDFRDFLSDKKLKATYLKSINYSLENGIYLLNEYNPSFELYNDNIISFNESNLYRKRETKKIRYKSVFGESKRIKTVDDLKVGDYVVHYDYGIAMYIGIKTMELSGIKRDYIHLVYQGNDNLYVPLEQINLIAKYQASEGTAPKLTKLGTTTWAKTKAKVKSKVNDISNRLIELYAKREQAKGFKFSPDTKEQYEFEADFEYEETVDQLRAIDDVKRDMESIKPMDRLICGDVGYGKTEIAMRAAFKAIMDGKQVAYLAPTTVLTKQHYQTFVSRFEKYGATIRVLNRFITGKELTKTLADIKAGLVDIVIGTHRLLSKDIEFKDLGLLIIDEEQRFGVIHKERIKEMKVNVDSMTLTATPIPRTLQMSIMGIKDLSMLDTPPKNRYPVQTYVIERTDSIIKEAIVREITRNGQVFYLYNRVSDIELMAAKIERLVPEARVCFAHGQMNKNDLEDVINAFINHEYDCIVCTTIIETGIDIPNSNTLIIHDANYLGLSQLYQLRGRVGRSNKIAYAYLMYDRNAKLTEEASKRLEAIKDFTELGSGYKIAYRDLSIRGSGDILGSEQSGFIDSVGYDLYMKILEESIKEAKGIKDDSEKTTETVNVNRTINEKYIEDSGVRIEIHKRINDIDSMEKLNDLSVELIDRFGKFDEELNLYMYEKLYNSLARRIGISESKKSVSIMKFTISKENSNKVDGIKLFQVGNEYKKEIKLIYTKGEIIINLDLRMVERHWLYIMCEFLLNYFSV